MSEYQKLKEEFERKVEQLQTTCPHADLGEWMVEWWALAHPTDYSVRLYKICGKAIEKRPTAKD